ncbi:23354_t:CDS:2 [Racocetra persica]|uniref:23354_t:CDS:1 n=1 Tax=Racocetra persica TaxID=160502 RepID=A0ACA9M995_9GLOM|nr:23354_t:CDS:2 [Racocetra persica]
MSKSATVEQLTNETNELKDSYFRLSIEVIEQIKNLPKYWDLTKEQQSLIEKMIPNPSLRNKYIRYRLCEECWQPNTNIKGNKWHRHIADGQSVQKVVLKSLHDSQNITKEFLQEITYYKLFNDISSQVVRCYDTNPTQRPTATELSKILGNWYGAFNTKEGKNNTSTHTKEFYQQYQELAAEEFKDEKSKRTTPLPRNVHSQAVYTSRFIDTEDIIKQLQNSQKINEQYYNADSDSLLLPHLINSENQFLLNKQIEQQAQIQIPPKNN